MSIKALFPPSIIRLVNAIRNKEEYGWYGNYQTWEAALNASTGYDSATILNKVKDALLKVKNNEAAFERDSVLFYDIEYAWPILSSLLWVAAQRQGKLNVLDFGGSLGSTFFQHKKFLNALDVKWNIVEQENFVTAGKKHFEDSRLHFYLTPKECLDENQIDVVLLSSVLPYIKEPYKMLQEIIELNIPFMIFDKMPFLEQGTNDLLTVQKVHPSIYEGSYPAWFFNEGRFLSFIEKKYEVVETFSGSDKANIPSVFKGILTQRRK